MNESAIAPLNRVELGLTGMTCAACVIGPEFGIDLLGGLTKIPLDTTAVRRGPAVTNCQPA